jgi:K+-transporting ATPase KdpF subunit
MEPLTLITPVIEGNSTGYIAGIIISFLLLGYLIYTLIRPEKF